MYLCVDFNECSELPSICPYNTECKNIFGTYECQCESGMISIGSRGNSKNVEICISPNEPYRFLSFIKEENTNCLQSEMGTFYCQCDPGFIGDPLSRNGCEKVDISKKFLIEISELVPIRFIKSLSPEYKFSLDFRNAFIDSLKRMGQIIENINGYTKYSIKVLEFT